MYLLMQRGYLVLIRNVLLITILSISFVNIRAFYFDYEITLIQVYVTNLWAPRVSTLCSVLSSVLANIKFQGILFRTIELHVIG